MKRSGFVFVLATAMLVGEWPAWGTEPGNGAPQVFLDKSPKIVAYQLKRLNNAQLLGVERKTDDPKYKPVYEAILTRKAMDKKFRQEAVDALAKLDKSDPVVVLLNAIGNVEADDKGTLHELVSMLMAQPATSLAAQREKIETLGKESQNPIVKEAAFAALATADTNPDHIWEQASQSPVDLRLALASLSMISDPKVRSSFHDRVRPLAESAMDQSTRAAAIDALGYITGHDPQTFQFLSGLIETGKGEARAAAVRAVRRIPEDQWPKDQIEPLARAVVKLVGQTPADQRTTPELAQAVQLGTELASQLPEAQGAEIRKSLRELGVRVVAIRTLREQMQYDLRYFVAQAGRPVEILLENGDAMPHNLVIVQPGALQEVAVAAGVMPAPADPNEKAYVPDNPKVFQSTRLVQPDEVATVNFVAPHKPGSYPYMCTFPGHWVRMYGVMLVVPDLEAWEKNPTPPKDPLTYQNMTPQKNAPTGSQDHQH